MKCCYSTLHEGLNGELGDAGHQGNGSIVKPSFFPC